MWILAGGTVGAVLVLLRMQLWIIGRLTSRSDGRIPKDADHWDLLGVSKGGFTSELRDASRVFRVQNNKISVFLIGSKTDFFLSTG